MGMSSNAAEYRAKALACEERARNETHYVAKLQYHEQARQWCSLADQLERLDAERTRKRDCAASEILSREVTPAVQPTAKSAVPSASRPRPVGGVETA
jgi:hypothetical protein